MSAAIDNLVKQMSNPNFAKQQHLSPVEEEIFLDAVNECYAFGEVHCKNEKVIQVFEEFGMIVKRKHKSAIICKTE